jgi:hypothetical protein
MNWSRVLERFAAVSVHTGSTPSVCSPSTTSLDRYMLHYPHVQPQTPSCALGVPPPRFPVPSHGLLTVRARPELCWVAVAGERFGLTAHAHSVSACSKHIARQWDSSWSRRRESRWLFSGLLYRVIWRSWRPRWSSGYRACHCTHGFKPDRGRWIFMGDKKSLARTSFGGEVKPSVPCRRFTACKRTLHSMSEMLWRPNFLTCLSPVIFSCFATRWLWFLNQADSKRCCGSSLATCSSNTLNQAMEPY